MILTLVLLPALTGAVAFGVRARALREGLLVGTALAHAGLVVGAVWLRPAQELGGWLGPAPLARLLEDAARLLGGS